jgi:hypothetical protein
LNESGLKTKSPVERPGFLFGRRRSYEVRSFEFIGAHLTPRAKRLTLVARIGSRQNQGRPSNGRSKSVTLATSVQKLLDTTKSRKFSMPLLPFLLRSLFCRTDV